MLAYLFRKLILSAFLCMRTAYMGCVRVTYALQLKQQPLGCGSWQKSSTCVGDASFGCPERAKDLTFNSIESFH